MTQLSENISQLAIHGGTPVRTCPMPPRFALGPGEEAMIHEVLAYYRKIDLDPGYQGHFEQLYCEAFTDFMGGGFADVVATGTAAIFVALAALELPKGSEVLVSPITDPGSLSAIVLNGLVPRLLDTRPNSFNVGPDEFEERITPEVRAAVIVHSLGQPAEIDRIVHLADKNDIRIIEDCSQSHGAMYKENFVGTFGDIAAFSTMYRKAHMTNASGGVIYTKNEELYRMALAHADRGKPVWKEGYDERNPNEFLFPALNLHSDEISCAIGISSLRRLPETIKKRLEFIAMLTEKLDEKSEFCRPYGYTPGDSPFVYPLMVDETKIICDKKTFAEAVLAEGIGLNPHYEYLVSDWPFMKAYLSDNYNTINARTMLDRCFMLYLNENYKCHEVLDCVSAILKVSSYFQE